MEGATWDFDAPTFVDFGKDEHEKNDGIEDYFNIHHEKLHSTGVTETDSGAFAPEKFADIQNNNTRQTFENTENVTLSNDNGEEGDAISLPESSNGKSTPSASTENIEMNTNGENTNDPSEIKPDNVSLVENKVEFDVDEKVLSSAGLHRVATHSEPGDSLDEMPSDGQDVAVDSLDDETAPESGTEAVGPSTDVQLTNMVEISDARSSDQNASTDVQMTNTMETADAGISDQNASTDLLMTSTVEVSGADQNDTNTSLEKPPTKSVLSNIITPSRSAMWDQGRKQRSTKIAPPNSARQRRSERLGSTKGWRRSERLTPSITSDDPPPSKKKKKNIQLVEPITPNVLKHHRLVNKFKSREEREIEEIEELKRLQRVRMEESSKSFKAAIKGPNLPSVSTIKTTKVKEFKFMTDERIKSVHTMDTRSQRLPSEVDFAQGLRHHPPSPKKLKPTVPKPFNFSSNRKRKLEQETNKGYSFKPMKKVVLDFQRNTRTSSSQSAVVKKGPMKAKPSLTIAKTPKLESRSRTRTVTVVSAKEKENQEVEEMKSYRFKAKAANQKILKHADTLPEIKRQRHKTVPIGFDLQIDKRIEERPKHEKATSPTREFKARPVPKAVLDARTQPNMVLNKSKNLATVPEKQQIKVKPFSFHDRDQERLAKKEQNIREILDSEKAKANSFRATPMVLQTDPTNSLPPKQVKPGTKPKPFKLCSDERGAAKSEKWKTNVENEVKTLREKAEFKANTNYTKILYGDAFRPISSNKCTDFEEFSLHTNIRASKREEFDEMIKQKEASILALNEERKRDSEIMEAEEAKRMRKETEHKAAPIRNYKQFVVESSSEVLTTPKSPKFSERFYKKATDPTK